MPPRKRPAAATEPEATPPPPARRPRTTAAKTSHYFESPSEDDERAAPPSAKKPRGRPSRAAAAAAAAAKEEEKIAGATPKKKNWGWPRTEDFAYDEQQPAAAEDEGRAVKKKNWGHPRVRPAASESPGADDGATAASSQKKMNRGWPRDGGAASDDNKTKPAPVSSSKPAKAKTTTGGRTATKAAPSAAAYDSAADEEDGSDEKDEFRIQIVAPVKLRPQGDTPYRDDTLHLNTLLFLQDLKANNNRAWLKTNDGEFRRAQDDFHKYVAALTRRVVAEVDDTVPGELPLRDVAFRIYRDTRFSKDPTPYKPNFSVAWSRTGRKGPYAVYYLHCEPAAGGGGAARKRGRRGGSGGGGGHTRATPGSCMLAGGLWCPGKDALALLRQSIDEQPARWREVLGSPALCREFLAPEQQQQQGEARHRAVDDDGDKAVALFAKHNAGSALKTRPRDYPADHADIALLRLKNFVLKRHIPDAWFTAEDGQDHVVALFRAMESFVTFLNDIVMPDPEAGGDQVVGGNGGSEHEEEVDVSTEEEEAEFSEGEEDDEE